MNFYSPLRYPGGKTSLAITISKAIKKNFTKDQEIILVEPYAGGAGASLKLLLTGEVNKVIINDFDKAIHSFWKIAVSDADFLIDKIKKTDISIEEWKKQKEIYNNRSSNTHDLAFATLFLNRTNHSGILGGGPIGALNQSGSWKINARFVKNTIIKRLENIQKFKNKIKVYGIDGVRLLKRLEKSKQNSNYYIFLDPPYYQKGKSLYLNHYHEEDHQKLAEFLKETSLKWIMTYDDTKFICNLYEEMYIKRFTIQHSAYKSKKGKEVMIFSDNSTVQPSRV